MGSLSVIALAAAASGLSGCTPAVGDHCALSTDCSIQGTRICDTSQPNGYCTLLACTANSCPDNATCVVFGASVPGCRYDDYGAPSRTGRAMCMKTCGSSADCRQGEGYVCADPTVSGWTVILDTNQSKHVCMVAGPMASFADAAVPQVCSPYRPDASALNSTADAEASREGGPDTGGDAADGPEEVADVGQEAADGGPDTSPEDGEGGSTIDATVDGGADAFGDVQADVPLDASADSDGADALDGG